MVVYQESAGFIVYYEDKDEIKFLLLKYPSYWGFVKGLIEEDEALKKTAKRELEEETKITKINILEDFKEKQEWYFKLDGKTIKKQCIYFIAKTNKKQARNVKISHEHEDYLWLNYEYALKKLGIKDNKKLLEKAYNHIKEKSKQQTLFN